MSLADEIAKHYAPVPVSPDGDCWINSVLLNYTDPPSIADTRSRIKMLIENSPEFCSAMNVSKRSITDVTKMARYNKAGKISRYGSWGEFWHMPALAITLGVDIVSLSHNNHVSYYCSSGVNLYFPPRIHMDEVIHRKDIVVISHNGVDHFDALLPLQKDLKLPIIPWLQSISCFSAAATPVCEFCDTTCEHDSVACATCGSVHAHASCEKRFHCARFVCDQCE